MIIIFINNYVYYNNYINNLICETLSPENIIAKLYLNNYDNNYKEEIINSMNKSLLMRDLPRYKNIIRSL